MAAVRVPPSAWRTSQSRMMVRSPSAFMSTTERRDRPMSRWISWVRPPTLPRSDSRGGAGEGGAGKHAVFGGDPAAAGVAEPAGNASLDRGIAEDAGIAGFDEDGALGGAGRSPGVRRMDRRSVGGTVVRDGRCAGGAGEA